MPLTDKVAVIVGATGQLGPAVARAFAHAGAQLALVGAHEGELIELFHGFSFREKKRMAFHAADVMEEASAQELADWVTIKFGHVDILLHLVGGYRAGTLRETTGESWELMMNLNVRTAFNVIRAFLPALTANGWGRILTVSAGVTQAPPAGSAAYVAAKAALEALTLSVAQDVKDSGLTANVVLIRSLDTPAERARQPNKTGGWVRSEDVASTLLFLCSEEAGAINGARIPVLG